MSRPKLTPEATVSLVAGVIAWLLLWVVTTALGGIGLMMGLARLGNPVGYWDAWAATCWLSGFFMAVVPPRKP